MTTEDLAAIVRQMRKLQRDYFRTRDQGTLRESKDMERRVDAALEHLAGTAQPGLFDQEARK